MHDRNLEQGRRIAQLRNELNTTQEEMAHDLGVSTRTVANWEAGVTHKLPRKALAALAEYVGSTPEYIEHGQTLRPAGEPDDLLDRLTRQQEILRRVASNRLLTAGQLEYLERALDALERAQPADEADPAAGTVEAA